MGRLAHCGNHENTSTWVNVRFRIIGFFGKTGTIVTCGEMKHKFAVLTAAAVLAIAGGVVRAQPPDTPQDAAPNGGALIAQAAQQLWHQPSLQTSIRQQIDLFGQQLVGSGIYLQKQSPRGHLLRLELKLGLDERPTTLQQVCDGDVLWICCVLPNRTTLGRVDLSRIRLALSKSGREPLAASTTNWMAMGGLPHLLGGLAANFDFGPARPAQLGEIQVWTSEGTWKPGKLAELLPGQKDSVLAREPVDFRQLAAHLPSSVLVVLGQEDLIPYRIEFRRRLPVAYPKVNRETAPTARAIVVLELFDVRRGITLDDRHFVHQPTGENVADHTGLYLRELGLLQEETQD